MVGNIIQPNGESSGWDNKSLLFEMTVTPDMLSPSGESYMGYSTNSLGSAVNNCEILLAEFYLQKSNDYKMLVQSYVFDRNDIINGISANNNGFVVRFFNQYFSMWFTRNAYDNNNQFTALVTGEGYTYFGTYTHKLKLYKLK